MMNRIKRYLTISFFVVIVILFLTGLLFYFLGKNNPTPCNVAWICYDNHTLAYRNPDCSYSNFTACPMGCENNACIENIIHQPEKYPNPFYKLGYVLSGVSLFLLGLHLFRERINDENKWKNINRKNIIYALFSELILYIGLLLLTFISKQSLLFNSFEAIQIGAIFLLVIGFLYQPFKENLKMYLNQIIVVTIIGSFIFFLSAVAISFQASFPQDTIVNTTNLINSAFLLGLLNMLTSIVTLFYFSYKNRMENIDKR